jgi:DNA-binding response OmpR family regulator
MNWNIPHSKPLGRILLVASGRAFREFNAAVLRTAGYLAESASDAAEAWEALRPVAPIFVRST